tara:strand:+ start:1753 stop:2904 length:1152 start_codon:yes stop_codon:yes gene_type:complete
MDFYSNPHNLIPRENNYVLNNKLLSIHSEDRDINKWPESNHFEIELPQTVTNVQSIQLVKIHLPGNQYTFSNNQQNTKLSFYLIPNKYNNISLQLALEANNNVPFNITIREGYYSPAEMANELENLMNQEVTRFLIEDASLNNSIVYDKFKVHYDRVGMKLFFGNTHDNFSFPFDKQIHYDVSCSKFAINNDEVWNRYTNWGLGSYLGFNKSAYKGIEITKPYYFNYANTMWLSPDTLDISDNSIAKAYYIESSFTVNIFGDTCIYMDMDKYNTIDELVPFSKETSNLYNNDYGGKVNSAFAKIPIMSNNNNYYLASNNDFLSNISSYNPIINNIKKLKFKFRYHDGRLVEFKESNFNFTLCFSELREEIKSNYNVRIPGGYN